MAYQVWRCLCSRRDYEPGLAKTSCIIDPTLRYIHIVIVWSFANRADSQGVMGKHDLLYLYSMTEHKSLHLGFILAEFLAYKWQHTCLSSIFARSYIMYLIRGMGLFGELEGQVIVGSMTSLGIGTLRSIGMVIRRGSRYILTPHPSELPPIPREALGDSSDDVTNNDLLPLVSYRQPKSTTSSPSTSF